MPKRKTLICCRLSFVTLFLLLISQPSHAPICNDPGKQDRGSGARPRVRVWVESRHASPSLYRCRPDSRRGRRPRQRRYADGPAGLR